MDTYQESQNALHVGPEAGAGEVDAAYHKWHAFWTACEINCMHPDQKDLARRELTRLDKAHRILRGRQLAVPAAQAEWFPAHVGQVPGLVRGTVTPIKFKVAAPPPLPRRHAHVPPTLPLLRQPLDNRAAFDWRPELLTAHMPDMGFIQSSKKRAAGAYRHMAAAVAVGMCMGLMAAGLIDYMP